MFPNCFFTYYQTLFHELHKQFFMAATYADPEGIHNLRVGIKRLRAFFRLVEEIAPGFHAKKTLRGMRALFKAAAEIRDLHVQEELARTWMRSLSVNLSIYYNSLKSKEIPARRRFIAFTRSFDLTQEFEKQARQLRQSLWPLSSEDAVHRIRARVMRLLDDILAFDLKDENQSATLHSLRILTKEARYTITFARQCFPELGFREELNQQLLHIHQVLGKWHDTEIALWHLAEFYQEYPDRKTEHLVCDHLQAEKSTLFRTFRKRWETGRPFLMIEKPTDHNVYPNMSPKENC